MYRFPLMQGSKFHMALTDPGPSALLNFGAEPRLRDRLDAERLARTRAEAACRALAEQVDQTRTEIDRLNLAMARAQDGIATTDATGHFNYLNSAHAQMFGYRPSELIGKPWSIFYDSEEAERLSREALPVTMASGEWRGEAHGRTRSGELILQDVMLTALPDGGLLCTTRDITDQRQRAAKASRLETRLHNAEHKAALFVIANAVAHDFNNLLGVVSSFSSLLAATTPPGTPQAQYIANITAAAEEAAGIIRALDTERRGDCLTRDELDLAKIVRTSVGIARAIMPARIALRLDLPETAHVHSNQVLISRCLFNLLKNAFHAMSDGGHLTIRLARTPSPPLDLAAAKTHFGESCGLERWILEITDTGPGIPPDRLTRVFDAFETTRERFAGSGLGLLSVRALTDFGGVTAHVESVVGLGTRFRLDFCVPA